MKSLWPAFAAGILFTAGCRHVEVHAGPALTETRVIERQGAESVQMEVVMAAGQLKMSGGAKSLLEADLRFAPESQRPEVRYDVTGFRGRLSVLQQHHRGPVVGRSVSDWDLRLNEDTPLDLHVKLGAGESRLDLGKLTLRNLEVELGAGSLKVDLTGQPKKTMDVRIRGGVGEAVVQLPRDVGIEVRAQGGIGEITTRGLRKHGDLYQTEEAERGKVAMRVDVRGGIGAIRLNAE